MGRNAICDPGAHRAVLVIVVSLISWAALVAAESDRPVGLVVNSTRAMLRRGGTELPLTAKRGDILFAGDTLIAAGGSVTFLFCPEKSSQTLAGSGEVVIQVAQLRVKSGELSAKSAQPICALPAVERESIAAEKHYGASLSRAGQPSPAVEPLQARIAKLPDAQRTALAAELAPIDEALAVNDHDFAARVARAAVFEKYHLRQDAIEEYRKIQAESPDAVWVRARLFVHEEEQAAEPPPRPPDPNLKGKTYALLVGISKYQVERISSLRYAHEDALLFASHLKSPRGGSLSDADITLLTEEKATLAAIRNAFDTLLKNKAGKQDTVLLFFAAHGTTTDKGIGYIIAHDSDPQDLASTALPVREVQKLFRDELDHVGRVLLYVDVCHAGTIGSVQNKSNRINTLVENLTDEGEMFGMLASRKDEIAIEGPQFGGGHGAFSYFLLDALNGAADSNNDGIVDAVEIVEYVSAKVKEATASRQHPKEIGNAGSTALAMTSKPGIQMQPYTGAALVASRNTASRQLAGSAGQPGAQSVPDPLEQFNDAIAGGRVLPERPGNAFAALNTLRGLLQPSDYRAQENRLRVALEDRGQQVLLQYLKGDQVPQARSDFTAGAAYFSSARLLTPESLLLESRENFCLGRAAIFDKQYNKAVDLLERAVRIDSTGAYSYNALGIVYLEQARYAEAIMAFKDAVRRASYWAYPLHNMALAYTQMGDYDAAIRCYEQAMRLAPQYSYLPYNLGLVYQRLNRRKEAEAAYRKAIELTPNLGEPYNALGYLKAAAGDRTEAERLYRMALQKNPDLLAARQNLALVLAQDADRFAEAVRMWQENLSKSPGYLPSRLSLAKALARAGRTNEAIEQYQALLKARPEYTAARRALAELEQRAGRFDSAVNELTQALQAQPANSLLYEQIGDVRRAQGNVTAAKASYESALKSAAEEPARKRIRKKIRQLGWR